MSSGDPITDLLVRSRRRFVWNEIFSQSVLAACLVSGGAILILVLGTQLLDWFWLALLLAGGIGTGVYRTIMRIPSSYRLAQIVDRRLSLNDSLSTAVFFGEDQTSVSAVSATLRAKQRAMAEQAARTGDPSVAVPVEAPRYRYALFACLLAVTGLFTLRYMLEQSLDVRAPLTQVFIDTFTGGRFEKRAAGKKQAITLPFESPPPDTPTQEAHPEELGEFDPAPDSALDTVDVPDVNNDKGANEQGGKKNTGKSGGDEPGEPEEMNGESGENADASGREGQGGQEREGKANSQADKKGASKDAQSSTNPSLASKLRDAMSNLLSRMKSQNNAGKQNGQQSNQQSGQQQAGAGQKGQQQGQKSGDQSGSSEDGQSGENDEGGQNSDGNNQGQGNEQQTSNSPGRGMGKQDGEKDVKLAEHLDAMGKISEIIGKRSANVTGEVTIEVQSTKQQLKTPYSLNRAAHTQSGGEINRDEVPAASQHYVQQYFERIRKQPPPPSAGSATPAPQAVPPSTRSARE